jgi:hypothetical protein
MERYVWAIVVMFVAVLGFVAALILGGRSEELSRFGLLVAQGVGFLANFYLIFRSNKNTENRVRHDVQNGVADAVEKGLETVVKLNNTPPPGKLPRIER